MTIDRVSSAIEFFLRKKLEAGDSLFPVLTACVAKNGSFVVCRYTAPTGQLEAEVLGVTPESPSVFELPVNALIVYGTGVAEQVVIRD